jgi:hypothetical protein
MSAQHTKKVRCKESVFESGCWGGRSCLRLAVKDGYCNQHHPDAEKARREKADKAWEEKCRRDPLRNALQKIKELEQQRDELLTVIKWANNHGGLGYAIHGAFNEAIAKAREVV